ncbi:hypothetical protein Tco_0270918 [Tanacetum coccineum]
MVTKYLQKSEEGACKVSEVYGGCGGEDLVKGGGEIMEDLEVVIYLCMDVFEQTNISLGNLVAIYKP